MKTAVTIAPKHTLFSLLLALCLAIVSASVMASDIEYSGPPLVDDYSGPVLVDNTQFVFTGMDHVEFRTLQFIEAQYPHLLPLKSTIYTWSSQYAIHPKVLTAVVDDFFAGQAVSGSQEEKNQVLQLAAGMEEVYFKNKKNPLAASKALKAVEKSLDFKLKHRPELAEKRHLKSFKDKKAKKTKPDTIKKADIVEGDFDVDANGYEINASDTTPLLFGYFQPPWPIGETWRGGGVHSGPPRNSLDFMQANHDWDDDLTAIWVTAMQAGTAFKTSECGLTVVHDNDWVTTYYHLENILVGVPVEGEAIERNDTISNYANTLAEAICSGGSSTGPHLHMSVYYQGERVPIDEDLLDFTVFSHHPGVGNYDSDCATSWYNHYTNGQVCPFYTELLNNDVLDRDGDTLNDAVDLDDDNDGVNDTLDAFPYDNTESVDTDGDGVGDNAENCINTWNQTQQNSDNDSFGNACDIDDDNDGYMDIDELIAGTDPLSNASVPVDSNSDFISDALDNHDLTYFENFDDSVAAYDAGWRQAADDDINWDINTGGTTSSSTGPDGDHTSGAGNYLYTEASNNFDLTAHYVSPQIAVFGTTRAAMSFWYHMYGSGMGELHIDVHDGTNWQLDALTPLIGASQSANNDSWVRAVVDLDAYIGQVIQVRFRGITGPTAYSDMAIDDVGFWRDGDLDSDGLSTMDELFIYNTNPNDAANTNLRGTGYQENFDNTGTLKHRGWVQPTSDDFDWSLLTLQTPSADTGPTGDYPTGTGNYFYTEASSNNLTTAELESPVLYLTNDSDALVSFWYHMFGAGMGELHVDINDGQGWQLDVVSPIIGQQQTASADPWQELIIDLRDYIGSTAQLRIRGITGVDYRSDIAIDRLTVWGLDTDSDGLADFRELYLTATNPANNDSDSDGYNDGYEYDAGTDPNDPGDFPAGDNDADGIPDAEDPDDDNDGVPDVVDADPLDNGNTNELNLPLDSDYKGLQFERR